MTNIQIIQTLEEAKKALEEAGDAEIILQSPPDALLYAGSMYFLEIFRQAENAYPNSKAIFVLDAGEACAEVIAAMQDGHKTIKSTAKAEIRKKLAAIARENGVNFIEINE